MVWQYPFPGDIGGCLVLILRSIGNIWVGFLRWLEVRKVNNFITVTINAGSIRPPCTGQSNFQGENKYFRKHNGDIEKTAWVVVSATVRVLEDSAMHSTVHAFRYSRLGWAGIPQHRDAPDDSFSHGWRSMVWAWWRLGQIFDQRVLPNNRPELCRVYSSPRCGKPINVKIFFEC